MALSPATFGDKYITSPEVGPWPESQPAENRVVVSFLYLPENQLSRVVLFVDVHFQDYWFFQGSWSWNENRFTWVNYVIKYYTPFRVSKKRLFIFRTLRCLLGAKATRCCQDLSVSHLCCCQHLSLLWAKSGGSNGLTSQCFSIEPCGEASMKAPSLALERRLCPCLGLWSAVMVRSRELWWPGSQLIETLLLC